MNRQAAKSPRSAEWADRLSATIGANVAAARRKAGLSAQDLAMRLKELGHPISRASISLLETGQRGVTVADLLALAAVLDSVPVALLTGIDDAVEALPKRTVHSMGFADWVTGKEVLPPDGVDHDAWLREPLLYGREVEQPAYSQLVWEYRRKLDGILRDLAGKYGDLVDASAGRPTRAELLRQSEGRADLGEAHKDPWLLSNLAGTVLRLAVDAERKRNWLVRDGIEISDLPSWVTDAERLAREILDQDAP